MGRSSKNPKKHIVSCRINNEEFEILADLAQKTGCNISNLLRRSLDLQIAGSEENVFSGN